MTTSDPQGEHDWHSEEYVDHWIGTDVTRDEERRPLLGKVAAFIPFDSDARIRVLDVGAGYGALSQQVLEAFPNAEAVCHDFSEPMFAHAKERLTWAGPRVSFVKGDLMSPEWTIPLGGLFDAVVSSIAIHNVRFPERIRGIYREVFTLVRPGGCFLNYDLFFPAGPLLRRTYRRSTLLARQRRLKAETGEERSLEELEQEMRQRRAGRPPGGGEARQLTEGAEPASLENQLRWLREAGFDESDCLWKETQTAIIGGFRQG